MKEIKEALKENKLIIGTRRVMKFLKNKKLRMIFYASNCPENVKKDLEYYSKISDTAVKSFEGNSKQLGELCGKPFTILMVGVKN
ncbi:MAG: 50S ribosomal protein L30e [Candidatus Aenigmatarchaeota archaeon]|nr:MAG: 50S ribosomal protein L30e [Candidatus Aenigmarchaeota archaeon]RLJ08930.1 MAG: 50S ribosomal protein L30e [Candidatus Aenigmarchaeota archaeon]RLJ09289.1 MAG: 50S ribosomal protein L30e [Candidatus Aenigmarchaeota archaeon]